MATPITWQNTGISMDGVAQLGQLATRNFESATEGLTNIGTNLDAQAEVEKNKAIQANTMKLLQQVQALNSPDAVAAAQQSGAFSADALMSKTGGLVDLGAVNSALQNQTTTLADKEKALFEFQSNQEQRLGAPVLAQYKLEMANATTPEAVAAIQEAYKGKLNSYAMGQAADVVDTVQKELLDTKATNQDIKASEQSVLSSKDAMKTGALTRQLTKFNLDQQKLEVKRREEGIKAIQGLQQNLLSGDMAPSEFGVKIASLDIPEGLKNQALTLGNNFETYSKDVGQAGAQAKASIIGDTTQAMFALDSQKAVLDQAFQEKTKVMQPIIDAERATDGLGQGEAARGALTGMVELYGENFDVGNAISRVQENVKRYELETGTTVPPAVIKAAIESADIDWSSAPFTDDELAPDGVYNQLKAIAPKMTETLVEYQKAKVQYNKDLAEIQANKSELTLIPQRMDMEYAKWLNNEGRAASVKERSAKFVSLYGQYGPAVKKLATKNLNNISEVAQSEQAVAKYAAAEAKEANINKSGNKELDGLKEKLKIERARLSSMEGTAAGRKGEKPYSLRKTRELVAETEADIKEMEAKIQAAVAENNKQ